MVNLDYMYNPNNEVVKKNVHKNYFIDRKLGFQVIEKGIVLPTKRIDSNNYHGGIIDNQNRYIINSFIHYGVGKPYTPSPESIQYRPETVIYFGISYPAWGHCITDLIRRAWFLHSEFMNEFKNCPVVYIPWYDVNIGRMADFKRLLEILDIKVEEFQEIKQPTQFDRIILPDESFISPRNIGNEGFTNEYRETIDRVRNFALKNRTPIPNKKLYFLHGGRSQMGEERLADYVKSKGYEIIRGENLTFDEEINLLINCEKFVATSGSCSHNSVFMRDNTEVTIIPRLHNHRGHTYQEIIDQVHLANVTYVDSQLSLFSWAVPFGHFYYIISEQLKRFFGDKWNGYEEEDFKGFLQYVRNCLFKDLSIVSGAENYYGNVLPDFMAQLKRREDLIASYNMPPHWEMFQPPLRYQTYLHMNASRDGWKTENEISNPLEQKLEILAIKVNFPNHKVYYSVYYNDREGWTKEVSNDEWAGITNERKPIFGIKIRLNEADTREFNILYRMHKFDGTWTPWAKNGQTLYSYGINLNAIQIKLSPIDTQPDKTQPDEFNDTYAKWIKKDETIYLQGSRQSFVSFKE